MGRVRDRAFEYVNGEPVLEASDGQPLGETDAHVDQILGLITSLRELARERHAAGLDDPALVVGGNQFFYYDRNDKQRRVAPDVYVLRGLPETFPAYPAWELPAPPELIIEVSSRSTWKEDLGRKKDVYRALGVREYVIYDPLGAIGDRGPLLAFVRGRRGFHEREVTDCHRLELLGATLQIEDGVLRVSERGRLIPITVAEGRAEGRAEEARRLVEVLLTARFGQLPTAARERLSGASLAQLETWLVRGATAADLDAVF